jgi:hypothetical protein
MKIADKIKQALSENPEIIKHRAELRAIYYLSKYDKTTLQIEWVTNQYKESYLTIFIMNQDGFPIDFKYLSYKPLSYYNYNNS